jgi:hypothetical protein
MDENAGTQATPLFVGLAGVRLLADSYDLGDGVSIRKTFAHFFAPYLAAFARPGAPGQPHPAPWKALDGGGVKHDVEVELCLPAQFALGRYDTLNSAWFLTALLRLRGPRGMIAPAASTSSFRSAAKDPCTILPVELAEACLMRTPSVGVLDPEMLDWLRRHWQSAAALAEASEPFSFALESVDGAFFVPRPSSAVMLFWGALERLFAPRSGEKRFRVSSALAAFLEPPGSGRYALFRKAQKLYDARSSVAHGSRTAVTGDVFADTYLLVERALTKMIEEKRVPTQEATDALLFGSSDLAED